MADKLCPNSGKTWEEIYGDGNGSLARHGELLLDVVRDWRPWPMVRARTLRCPYCFWSATRLARVKVRDEPFPHPTADDAWRDPSAFRPYDRPRPATLDEIREHYMDLTGRWGAFSPIYVRPVLAPNGFVPVPHSSAYRFDGRELHSAFYNLLGQHFWSQPYLDQLLMWEVMNACWMPAADGPLPLDAQFRYHGG